MNKTKSFEISKSLVWRAWQQVQANKGSAGVDQVSIADYEQNLSNNLYRLWNRMCCSFDFLGFGFRPRLGPSRRGDGIYLGFTPAITILVFP